MQDNQIVINEILPNVLEIENIFEDLPEIFKYLNDSKWEDWNRFNGEKIGTKVEILENNTYLFNKFTNICNEALNQYTNKYNLLQNKYKLLGKEQFEVLKWDFPQIGMNPHKDHSYDKKYIPHISICIYLNNDYEGGEFGLTDYNLYFKPKANSAIIFPSDTVHEVKDLKEGNRYVITKFFTLTNS